MENEEFERLKNDFIWELGYLERFIEEDAFSADGIVCDIVSKDDVIWHIDRLIKEVGEWENE